MKVKRLDNLRETENYHVVPHDVWERKWQEDDRDPWRTLQREQPNDFSIVSIQHMKSNGVSRLLELGPGAGRDTQAFLDAGLDITAVEISQSGTERIKRDFPSVTVIQGDIRDVDLSKRGVFDAIYAFSVLHYFNDTELKYIYFKLLNRLRDNGIIYIATRSSKDSMYGKGKKINDNTFLFNGAERRFYTPKTIACQLETNGFEVESILDRTVQYHPHDKAFLSTFLEVIARKKRAR